MYLIRIAWRNLTRNKIRTLIAILAIMAVVMIVIFARGLMVGFTGSNFKSYIDNQYGHVRLLEEEYDVREPLMPLDYTVDGFNGGGLKQMVSELKEIDDIEYILPRIKFGAMTTVEDEIVRMVGVGTDTAVEKQHDALPPDVATGRMPETGNEILVGKGLLNDLQANIGDRITITFLDSFQSLQGRTFEIVGSRDSGVPQLDDNFFYLPLATAQEILWLEDEATELMIFGSDSGVAEELKKKIDGLLVARGSEHYLTQAWNRADPMVEMYNEVGEVMNLVYVLFILLGTVVVISTLSMIVRERTSEIGMMAALGLKSREIMKVFVLEGSFMGILGSLLGVIGGGLITFYYSIKGLHVQAFADAMGEMDVLFEPVFHIAFNFENLVVSFILGVIIVTLACFYPAYQAARMKPVDALYYVEE